MAKNYIKVTYRTRISLVLSFEVSVIFYIILPLIGEIEGNFLHTSPFTG